jgi:hypothetical protein
VILTALAVPGFALGLATAAGEFTRGDVPVHGQPSSIVWGDRVYSNKQDLAVWLRSRGASYWRWAGRHPAAAEILEGSRTRAVADRPKRARSARLAAAPDRAPESHTTLAIGLVLASTLGLAALVVSVRGRRPRGAPARPGPHRRAEARHGETSGWNEPASRRMPKAARLEKLRTASREARVAFGSRVRSSAAAVGHESLFLRKYLRMPSAERLKELWTASREARAAVGRRVGQSAAAGGHESILAREYLRHHTRDVAMYVASVLLAIVVGASLALYMN